MKKKTPLVVLLGPTASGKTDVALELARKINGEIISADSRQLYRGMDIGTAKPTKEQQKEIPHHLIDIVAPGKDFTVHDFVALARKKIYEIQKSEVRSRNPKSKIQSPKYCTPLIVGGTGFYIRALVDNVSLASVPAQKEFRESMRLFAEEKGADALHKKLSEADAEEAKKVHPNDVKKIIRALEIVHVSGKPKSFFKEKSLHSPPVTAKLFGLCLPRGILNERINRRAQQMIENGLVDEVKTLLEKGFDEHCNSMTGIGYRQIIGYLKGEYSLGHALELIQRDTRHFAKRQNTYFKTIRQPVTWIDAHDKTAGEIADEIITYFKIVMRVTQAES